MPPIFCSTLWAHELIALTLTATHDNLPLVWHKMLEHTVKELGGSSGTLAFVNQDRASLTIVAGIELPAAVIGRSLPLAEGILGLVAEMGEPLLLNGDLSQDPRYAIRAKYSAPSKTASALCWPLLRDEQVVGVISINRRAERAAFTEETLTAAAPCIAFVSLALQIAEHYAQAQQPPTASESSVTKTATKTTTPTSAHRV